VNDGPASGSVFINTLVGVGSVVKGDLSVQGFFRVDGDLHGSVLTEGRILVAPTGRVKGRLSARDIVVGGVVKGDLYATERICLLSTALILGTVYAPRIQIDQGALLEGYACAAPRIREEGIQPLHSQKPFTLRFEPRTQAALPLSDGP